MRPVVVAPAPFKAALPASDAARAIAAGVRLGAPGTTPVEAPVADGGEGTLDALLAATGGRRRGAVASDPVGRPIEAAVGELPNRVAVVELAQAAGFERLSPAERDAEAATTRGVGALIRAALDMGASRIVVGLGGSATTDGGLGLAVELGARALGSRGQELEGRGADMAHVLSLDLSGLDPRLAETTIDVAVDVDNPFAGERGAAHVFGPQKGADAAAVKRLDAGLRNLAVAMRAATGVDVHRIAGAGAAGGAAGGICAMLGGRLRPGAELVLESLDFMSKLDGAGLCVTGEGRLDETTARGKAPAAVAAASRERGIPCVALVGEVALGLRAIREMGLTAVLPIARELRSVDLARSATEADLTAAGSAVGALYARWGAVPTS